VCHEGRACHLPALQALVRSDVVLRNASDDIDGMEVATAGVLKVVRLDGR